MSHAGEEHSPNADSPAGGEQMASSSIYPILPLPLDPDFVLRPEIVEWLHLRSAQGGRRVALVGPSGVGKTQLAMYYAQSVRDSVPQTRIFWVQASARVSFQESYGRIAHHLQLQDLVDGQFGRLQQVHDALTKEICGPWLLILDDANDIDALTASLVHPIDNHPTLASFLPASPNGSIIITSCVMDVAKVLSSEDDICSVLAMDEEQAIQLVQAKIGEEDMAVKLEFIEALNRMPLAISQAAAYMNAQTPPTSMRVYLDHFQEYHCRETHVLNQGCNISSKPGIYAGFYSTATTWHITFEYISRKRPSAADLLQFMSFSNPQRIQGPVARAYNRSHRGGNDDAFNQDIAILCKYSLLAITSEEDIFQMHTALQLYIQMWLSANHSQEWRQKCLAALSNSCQPNVTNQGEKQQKSSQTIIWDRPHRSYFGLNWAKLLSSVGWHRLRTGNYGGAEHVLQDSMVIINKVAGPDDLLAIATESMLAGVYQGLGKFEAAEEIHRRALDTRARVLGSEHADTLLSESSLATVLQYLGKYGEAEDIHRKIFEIRKRILGPCHVDTLTSANNVALQLKYQGSYEEAEKMIREVAQEAQDRFGSLHPFTLATVHNFALILQDRGKYHEAEKLNRQVLAASVTELGGNHPDTLTSLDNLATVLQKQGKHEEAEIFSRRALNARQTVLGLDHPDTLASQYNLAYLLHRQGRTSDATHLYSRAYEGFKKVLGEEHPITKGCGAHYSSLRNQTRAMALDMDQE